MPSNDPDYMRKYMRRYRGGIDLARASSRIIFSKRHPTWDEALLTEPYAERKLRKAQEKAEARKDPGQDDDV